MLLIAWILAFDIRTLLGKAVGWGRSMTSRTVAQRLVVPPSAWSCSSLLYAPLVPPFFKSLEASGGESGWQHYQGLNDDLVISDAVNRSLQLAVVVGVVTALLALLAGLAIRRSRIPKILIVAMLMPLFVPGVSAGLSSAMFFKYIGLEPSLLSMVHRAGLLLPALRVPHRRHQHVDLRGAADRGGVHERRARHCERSGPSSFP